MYKLLSSTIEITRRCNAKCVHCIIDAGQAMPVELSTQEILTLIEDMNDLGCQSIALTGGEPFLRKEWPLFLQKINSLDMQAIFMTNAMLINDDVLDILKLYPNTAIGISLDGPDKETHDYVRGVSGIFEHFCEIVPKLKEIGIYVAIPTTVMQSNYDKLDDILNLLISLGVDAWQLQIVKPSERLPKDELLTEKQYYDLAKKITEYRENYLDKINIMESDCIGYFSQLQPKLHIQNWRGCECGIYSVSIEADGNVKGCPNMNNSEGNIKTRPFKEIWADHNSFKYNRSPQIELLKGYCNECKHKYICRGGCPTNPRTQQGSAFCLYKIEQQGFDE